MGLRGFASKNSSEREPANLITVLHGMKKLLLLILCVVPVASLLAQESMAEVSATAAAASYELRPGDSVRITVFNEPDLDTQQKLDADGVAIIPLLGRVNLAGRSLRDAESWLERQFIDQEYLIQPQVTVSVTQHAQQVFYIFGEVNNPGAKAIPAGRSSVDILEAITLAGDLGQFARRSEILLRRPKPDGSEERIQIDLERILRGGRARDGELVQVLPQDIIFVPERIF